MMARTVVIVQARMGSTRFPGKMLARLGDCSVLEWVIRRVLRAGMVDEVVLATSDLARDNALAEIAMRCGASVFRGGEDDVLGRFLGAAQFTKADNVVRVCADNPFIDPREVDRLVAYFSQYSCDYACNHQDRLGSGYADGFGAEIFSVKILEQIAERAMERQHREHVTLFLWDHSEGYELRAVPAPVELTFPRVRCDVDTPEDLAKLAKLVQLGVTIDSSAAQIIKQVLAMPLSQ